MADAHLDTAVDRLDAALSRIETALAGSQTGATLQHSANAAALVALEQRHAALRKVLSDSVRELDTLLEAAEAWPQPEAGG